ncbi:MAG: 3-deoxy-8-phosphooctulonate synthase, partial [Planctomycetes bacterium]|nr:3-deoxy-8-phosphooctulonate synthase [Planctomycetota bacterium]
MTTPVRTVKMGKTAIGGGKLTLIAGPCSIESEKHARAMAESLLRITGELGMPYVFKASFDKANRTSAKGFRGPGLEKGLSILAAIKKDFEVPVLSDVHETCQVASAAEVLDVIQIHALLSRQTDLLLAAGKSGKPVNLKKGQFMAPLDMKNALDKIV